MFVAIQASSYQQACLAAEQLGLPKPDGHTRRVVNGEEIIAMFVTDSRQVQGTLPDRVVFVYPRLEYTIVDRLKHDDCRTQLKHRFMRALSYRGELPADGDLDAYVESRIERVET